MADESTTIARPYAEAIFAHAIETERLDLWSDMLSFLAAVVSDSALSTLMHSPSLTSDQKAELLIEIGGGRLSDEGQNLVKLLVQNDRLAVLADIQSLYEARKSSHEGAIDVHITSAFAILPAQEKILVEALKKKLGCEIRISSEVNSELIGGISIRAGDLVIDGSIQGQLHKLANALAI